MMRQIFGVVLLFLALVGCASDSSTGTGDGDTDLLLREEDELDELEAVDDAADDVSSSGTTTTVSPRLASRPNFEVVDGVTRFNSAVRLPSLWGVLENDDPIFDGGGISFYRSAPDATTIAMAISNSCAQVLLDIEQGADFGSGEWWVVTQVVSVESTCETPLTELFVVGDEVQLDMFDPHTMVIASSKFFIFATMFESFSDQGDPRRDPAGAVAGRTPTNFG